MGRIIITAHRTVVSGCEGPNLQTQPTDLLSFATPQDAHMSSTRIDRFRYVDLAKAPCCPLWTPRAAESGHTEHGHLGSR